ncbi:MAG: orotidine-5'-phosphate decarboxylase [Oscillospiraceae bacterium]|jgi:orotidine-5'-phosphate decarboxylase|nr:orotidine-5'-phosphate decarboxylase [Oscillospiraceae bacterium]
MKKGVIIACDFKNKLETFNFLEKFKGREIFIKIGMELFLNEGRDIVENIKKMGIKIFLDLKLHDIPNTIKKTMELISDLEVDMTTVHASGGRRMIFEAKNSLQRFKSHTKLLAVTVLTSVSQDVLENELLIKKPILEVVENYAKTAKDSGADGVICSAKETLQVRRVCGENFLTVTPGIRQKNCNFNDQLRVVTAEQAKKLGSNFIVVGRPITLSADPIKIYEEISNDFL